MDDQETRPLAGTGEETDESGVTRFGRTPESSGGVKTGFGDETSRSSPETAEESAVVTDGSKVHAPTPEGIDRSVELGPQDAGTGDKEGLPDVAPSPAPADEAEEVDEVPPAEADSTSLGDDDAEAPAVDVEPPAVDVEPPAVEPPEDVAPVDEAPVEEASAEDDGGISLGDLPPIQDEEVIDDNFGGGAGSSGLADVATDAPQGFHTREVDDHFGSGATSGRVAALDLDRDDDFDDDLDDLDDLE